MSDLDERLSRGLPALLGDNASGADAQRDHAHGVDEGRFQNAKIAA